MVLLDPAEEIRRLMEDEDMPRDEASAKVRADLSHRQEVETKPWKKSGNHPQYRWDNKSAMRGNIAARGKSGRPRSKSKTFGTGPPPG